MDSFYPHGSIGQILVRDVDDWLGVSDSRERRKIQNRRNQRASRSKKRGTAAATGTGIETLQGADNHRATTTVSRSGSGSRSLPGVGGHSRSTPPFECSEILNINAITDITDATIQIINLVKILEPSWKGNQLVMDRFEAFATRSYTAHIGALNLLPSLSQFNFVKALFANIEVLGLSDEEMDDEAFSPFNKLRGPYPLEPNLTTTRFLGLPTALQPSDLQRSTLHHPWIDLLPMPALRDNILRQHADSFDEAELCHAMRGQAPDHNPGLLVWSDPWDPTGWEVTDEFLKTWGWVIISCSDLLHSTNTWRARRGEKPLSLEWDPAS
ncbi:hypothetical protein HYALB_00011086 [Hymenoscyphus albidus]|uniref:BZIP domain-containing protein n=1 Tax=Hymenoscyphus albidus TaxID=595503 RepID=A0A9N9LYX9_9HELO|nr:hypothetical protein HYALB_00011086 [Hymenoscyphus albidus]